MARRKQPDFKWTPPRKLADARLRPSRRRVMIGCSEIEQRSMFDQPLNSVMM